MRPEIELVTTGAELLNGRVVNRHAAWLGNQLEQIGWRLTRDTTVPDDRTAIRDALLSATSRSSIVLLTGGLGPTTDDVTRDVAAEWFGTSVIMHEPSRAVVINLYNARNKPLNNTVERHALVVEGADVLENHHGLAPGERLEKHGRVVFLLPGPPREFQGVMRDHVLPWLVQQDCAPAVRMTLFQTVGIGESDIAARLETSGFDQLNVEVAYCAEPGRVSIRLREQPGNADEFDQAGTILRASLADVIYAESDETMEQAVGRILIRQRQTLAVAESCTGGLIGERLTSMPGSSAFMRGGVIAYHNDLKTNLLGVDAAVLEKDGAVSESVALAMAHGVMKIADSDIGLAITGIAGPGGGTDEKPVGLIFAAAVSNSKATVKKLHLGGDRNTIREAAATIALNLVRLIAIPSGD